MEPNLLKEILIVSEKAANIARICRQDEHLLQLLTQEKSEEEKNQRFAADFKTLADVLIQEVVKQQLTTKFPSLQGNIHGEESNVFTNTTGESIVVQVADPADLKSALVQILNGDQSAAECLIQAVYSEPSVPLSGTEYINGNLSCALVLIGVFCKSDGTPVLGVVNQPFHEYLETDSSKVAGSWSGRVYWGVCREDVRRHSEIPMQEFKRETLIIAVSSSENSRIRDCLLDNGYEVLPLPGAGYKILSVILNKCDVYLCSKPSTYVWDTLACQAILESMTLGGSIVECRGNCEGSEGEDSRGDRGGSHPESEGEDLRGHGGTSSGNEGEDVRGDSGGTSSDNEEPRRLTYDRYEDRCNKNGLVAYRDLDTAVRWKVLTDKIQGHAKRAREIRKKEFNHE
ncbi:hypothetical protein M8J76_012756 [Diaphorina citri]|nr:hypothetical protein M8J76_012756 [Diaphorina citri]